MDATPVYMWSLAALCSQIPRNIRATVTFNHLIISFALLLLNYCGRCIMARDREAQRLYQTIQNTKLLQIIICRSRWPTPNSLVLLFCVESHFNFPNSFVWQCSHTIHDFVIFDTIYPMWLMKCRKFCIFVHRCGNFRLSDMRNKLRWPQLKRAIVHQFDSIWQFLWIISVQFVRPF